MCASRLPGLPSAALGAYRPYGTFSFSIGKNWRGTNLFLVEGINLFPAVWLPEGSIHESHISMGFRRHKLSLWNADQNSKAETKYSGGVHRFPQEVGRTSVEEGSEGSHHVSAALAFGHQVASFFFAKAFLTASFQSGTRYFFGLTF